MTQQTAKRVVGWRVVAGKEGEIRSRVLTLDEARRAARILAFNDPRALPVVIPVERDVPIDEAPNDKEK